MNKQNQLQALNNLKVIKKLFDEEKIRYWLDFGTLLCAYRDGDLEHEHDTDISVFIEDYPKIQKLESKLNKLYSNSVGTFCFNVNSPIITSWEYKDVQTNKIMHGDIFYWYPVKVTMNRKIEIYRYCHGKLIFSLPEHLLNNFSTISFKNLDLDNTQFNIPKKTEKYLEYFFGKDDWKIKMTNEEYQNKQDKMLRNEIAPYLINIHIPEIIEFKRKMISGLLQRSDY